MGEGRRAARLDLSEVVTELDEEIERYDGGAIRDKVLKRLKKMGFAPTPQPTRKGKPLIPVLPEKISSIPNKELTNKRGEYVTVYAYAAEMRVLADVVAEAFEEQAKYVRERVFKDAAGNLKEREAAARTHGKFVELNAKRIEWKGVAALLASKCGTLEAASAVLSRDVEFRTRDFDQHKRNHNMSRQKRHRDRAFRNDEKWSGEDDDG